MVTKCMEFITLSPSPAKQVAEAEIEGASELLTQRYGHWDYLGYGGKSECCRRDNKEANCVFLPQSLGRVLSISGKDFGLDYKCQSYLKKKK